MTKRTDVSGDVAALLGAYRAGDEAGFDAVMSKTNQGAAAAFLVGLVDKLGGIAYGSPEAFGAALIRWVPGEQLPDPER